MAMTYIRQYPGQFVVRSLKKLVRLHDRQSIGVVWNLEGLSLHLNEAGIFLVKLASNLYWWLALALAGGGVVQLAKIRGFLSTILQPAVFFWLFFAFLHAVIVVTDRYNIPMVPPIAILAASFSPPWITSSAPYNSQE